MIRFDILVIKFFVIKKSDGGWKDINRCFYIGLIGLITSSSIDLRLIQLVDVDNLVSIKRKTLMYKKEELWINAVKSDSKSLIKLLMKIEKKRSYLIYLNNRPIGFKNKKIRKKDLVSNILINSLRHIYKAIDFYYT